MEVRGLTDDNRITIPYFIQFNNGKGSFDKTEWQTTLRKGMKARMELAWYGCCEAANYQGPRAPVMDAAGGFYTLTYKWDSANVYLYQGRGTAISAIHSLPNRLGSFMPSDWKNGCKSRATKGSIIPLKIELPERHYGLAFKYWFRNFKLTKIK